MGNILMYIEPFIIIFFIITLFICSVGRVKRIYKYLPAILSIIGIIVYNFLARSQYGVRGGLLFIFTNMIVLPSTVVSLAIAVTFDITRFIAAKYNSPSKLRLKEGKTIKKITRIAITQLVSILLSLASVASLQWIFRINDNIINGAIQELAIVIPIIIIFLLSLILYLISLPYERTNLPLIAVPYVIYLTIFSEVAFNIYPLLPDEVITPLILLGMMAILWIGVIGGVLLAMEVKKTKLKAVP